MRARFASLSFLLASVSVAIAWLTLLPIIFRLMEVARRGAVGHEQGGLEQTRALLPLLLAADVTVVMTAVVLILYFALAKPLRETEATIEQLERLRLELPISPGGGPLLSRIQSSLRRMASALADEKALTLRRMEELRASNERLSRTQAELVAAERLAAVGLLAAGVAHEVGNPLSGVLGYVSILRGRIKEPQSSEFIDRIESELERINRIVKGLVELGRPPRVELQPVVVSELVRNCVQILSAGPDLSRARIELDLPENVMVRADPGPFSQIVINLLINAGQAMGGAGVILVRASSSQARVQVVVEDSGPGLPLQVLERIFEPFFTTKNAGQGSGLGLAVSLSLARSMEGNLWAENCSEGGARFVLELPAG